MIVTFKDSLTEKIATAKTVKGFPNGLVRVAQRKLVILQNAVTLKDLAGPPGNRLEALKGNRSSQYSIRINDQYRICFEWQDGNVKNVEIVDYHN